MRGVGVIGWALRRGRGAVRSLRHKPRRKTLRREADLKPLMCPSRSKTTNAVVMVSACGLLTRCSSRVFQHGKLMPSCRGARNCVR